MTKFGKGDQGKEADELTSAQAYGKSEFERELRLSVLVVREDFVLIDV